MALGQASSAGRRNQSIGGNHRMSTFVHATAAALGLGVAIGLMPTSSALAEPVDCVSTAAWQQWASANRWRIDQGHAHLSKAKRALSRGVSQRKVSNNLYSAGQFFRAVSASPDGFAGSFYRSAGTDFQQAARAVDSYRIKRASREWSDGNWNLRNAGNAIKLCVDALEGR